MRKLNVAIFAGLLVAILGFAGVFYYATTVDDRIADGRRTVNVLVAKTPLASGALSATLGDKVEVKAVPSAYVPEGYLENLGQVSNLVLLGPVATGVQLNRADFGQPDAAASNAITPKPGRLAIAIGLGVEPGVARYVGPNSKVDLFVTYDSTVPAAPAGTTPGGKPTSAQNQSILTSDGTQNTNGRTRLFMSSVTVLSVTLAPTPATGTMTTTANTTGTAPSNVLVVLDLSPEDSEKVINAQQVGKIYLGLAYSKIETDGTITGEIHRTQTGITAADVINPQVTLPGATAAP